MAEIHRYHAAGHISAANVAMGAVEQFVGLPQVSAPEQVKDKIRQIRADLTLLEKWFIDPLNTTIENT